MMSSKTKLNIWRNYYKAKLNLLLKLGYKDRTKNLKLLRKYGGDVDLVKRNYGVQPKPQKTKEITNDYHAKCLPEFVLQFNENMEKRVGKTLEIINSNKHTKEFRLPSNFLNKTKDILKPLISEQSKVSVKSFEKNAITSLNEYKGLARDKFYKKWSAFLGDYVFGPIIYDYLFQYLFNGIHSLLEFKTRMIIFIDICVDMFRSQIKFNGSNRQYPLIPHRAIQTGKFETSSKCLLKHFNLLHTLDTSGAQAMFDDFNKCLQNIKKMCAPFGRNLFSEKENKAFVTNITELYKKNRINYQTKTENKQRNQDTNDREEKKLEEELDILARKILTKFSKEFDETKGDKWEKEILKKNESAIENEPSLGGMSIREIKQLQTNDKIYFKNANNEWILVKVALFHTIKNRLQLRSIENGALIHNFEYASRNDKEQILIFAKSVSNKVCDNKSQNVNKEIDPSKSLPPNKNNMCTKAKTEATHESKVKEKRKRRMARQSWAKGDQVEIFSNTDQKWYLGEVTAISKDHEGEWLKCAWVSANGHAMIKPVKRFWSHTIRPVQDHSSGDSKAYLSTVESELKKSITTNSEKCASVSRINTEGIAQKHNFTNVNNSEIDNKSDKIKKEIDSNNNDDHKSYDTHKEIQYAKKLLPQNTNACPKVKTDIKPEVHNSKESKTPHSCVSHCETVSSTDESEDEFEQLERALDMSMCTEGLVRTNGNKYNSEINNESDKMNKCLSPQTIPTTDNNSTTPQDSDQMNTKRFEKRNKSDKIKKINSNKNDVDDNKSHNMNKETQPAVKLLRPNKNKYPKFLQHKSIVSKISASKVRFNAKSVSVFKARQSWGKGDEVDTDQKWAIVDHKNKYDFSLSQILIFISVGIILISLFLASNSFNDREQLSKEETYKRLLSKHDISHMWSTLIEAHFDDTMLWTDITHDMLDKMNVSDSDKIRFSRLQKEMRNSRSASEYIREMLRKYADKIIFPAIGSIAFYVWKKVQLFRNG